MPKIDKKLYKTFVKLHGTLDVNIINLLKKAVSDKLNLDVIKRLSHKAALLNKSVLLNNVEHEGFGIPTTKFKYQSGKVKINALKVTNTQYLSKEITLIKKVYLKDLSLFKNHEKLSKLNHGLENVLNDFIKSNKKKIRYQKIENNQQIYEADVNTIEKQEKEFYELKNENIVSDMKLLEESIIKKID